MGYLLTFLLLSAAYLQVFAAGHTFYLLVVLAHIAAGLLLTALFLARVATRGILASVPQPRVWRVSAVLFWLCALTGIVVVWLGATGIGGSFLSIHLASAAGLIMVGTVTLYRAGGWFHAWPYARFALALAVVLVVGHAWSDAPVATNNSPLAQSRFFPSPGRTITGEYLSEGDLNRSARCGEAGCHPDIHAQWQQSAHRLSSFNNPFYQKSVSYLLATREAETARWCGSCHDPVMLYTGLMEHDPDPDLPAASAGVTCETCHGMVEIPDVTGNGNYVLASPVEYPFSRAGGLLGKVNRVLIRAKPGPHRTGMLKPFHRTAEFCATCHKVSLDKPVNLYRWLRGQDEYDAWHHSGVSRNAVASFYSASSSTLCQDCHMYAEASRDMGHNEGIVRGHYFPGANTALPALATPPVDAWIGRTTEFLQDERVTVDIFGAIREDKLVAPLNDCFEVEPGREVQFEVVVRTRNIGHEFPGGTIDSNEPWLQIRATDGAGRLVFHSGELLRDGSVDPSAHFFHGLLLDRHGEFIAKRNAHEWVTTLYKHAIPPGSAEVVHYRWRVPRDFTGELTLVAQVNYRKFNRLLTTISLGAAAPPLPVTVMATDTLRLRGTVTPGNCSASTTGARRFNDYGIGLLRQANLAGARRAFEEQVRRDPDYVDGYLNVARVLIKEGNFHEALTYLNQADYREPGYEKTAYFRGVIAKMKGDYALAATHFERVRLHYPRDRELLKALGQTYYYQGEVGLAEGLFLDALAVNPEDATGHYNLMLIYEAKGETEQAQRHRMHYLKYKPEEEARSISQSTRLRFPYANNEAQPIHHHELLQP